MTFRARGHYDPDPDPGRGNKKVFLNSLVFAVVMKSFINHSDPHQSASWFLRFERVSDVFGCLGASENIPIDNVKPSYKWL